MSNTDKRKQKDSDSREISTGRDYLEQVWRDAYTSEVTQFNFYTAADAPSPDEQAALQDAYLRYLLGTCGRVFLRGIDRNAASQEQEACLHLDAIYTALLTQSTEHSPLEGGQGGVFPSWEGLGVGSFPSREGLGVGSEGRRLSALAQVNRHQRLVLLGDPGSGKSTFVDFVSICLAGERLHDPHTNLGLLTAPLPTEKDEEKEQPQPWDHGALLPVRILLREFAARGLPSYGEAARAKHLWDFIEQELEQAILEEYAPVLQKQLRDLGGLVLLDGLDEVPEADQRRTQIKQVVEDFARCFPRCRMLVTSRIYAYQQQEWRLHGFAEAVLAPFTSGQIRAFIERWYRHSAEVRGKDSENAMGEAELLKQAIARSDRLSSLAERPLLLTLMASLHYWRGGSLPEKREELYHETVDLLLDWWERPKVIRGKDGQLTIAQESLTELLKVGKSPVRSALETLAFQAHSVQSELVGTANITEADLVSTLMQVSQNRDLRPTRLIEYLSIRAGLLVPRGVGIYAFPHRTFQEYLAACYLTNQDPDVVAELARCEPNRWREVVLLAGAKAARGADFSVWVIVEALCYRSLDEPDSSVQDVWGGLLAGQILAETANLQQISPRNHSKVRRVRDWLVAILTEQQPAGSPFPATERALVGNILAQLGDHRSGVGLRGDGLPDITWCEVPKGAFTMGSDSEQVKRAQVEVENSNYDDGVKNILKNWILAEKPQHEVCLSPYQMSRYPVTNAQYQAFVEDGGKRNQTYGGDFDRPNHPVVGVSWHDAVAFCKWLTLRLRESGELTENQEIRLPTEAEWEKAARGTDGRIYPWGRDITPEYANYGDTGLGFTSTVGCFPRGSSPYGCEEMAGNVYEWCLDWFDEGYYKKSPRENPQGPESGSIRVHRGGRWGGDARHCRSACRSPWNDPGYRSALCGLRLLRTPS